MNTDSVIRKWRDPILSLAAFLAGFTFIFIFLTINNPDKVEKVIVILFNWSVLFPVALTLGAIFQKKVWLGCIAMTFGIFLGTCSRCSDSNIAPIAAAFWTADTFLPILAGSLIGGLFGLLFKSQKIRRDSR
jgi:hypothetical protein